MTKKFTFKGLGQLLKEAFKGFGDDKVTKLSGSLAYSTVFSMAPLLVVIISVCSVVLGQEAIQGRIYGTLENFMGHDTAMQLQDIVKNAALKGKSGVALTIGIIVLLFGATAIFGEIQDSINTIWGLKAKPKKGWLKMLRNRFLSFSLIISLGFLLLVSLGLTAVVDGLNEKLQKFFPEVTIVIFYIVNQILTFLVVGFIFAVIFKVLPDAKIRWKDVFAGATVTALLFMLGKFGISLYITKTSVGNTYGAAGSLVILLLWTYYSSMILYFGAEFTKAYALKFGAAIHPNDYAVTTKQVEVEKGRKTIQQNEAEKTAEKNEEKKKND